LKNFGDDEVALAANVPYQAAEIDMPLFTVEEILEVTGARMPVHGSRRSWKAIRRLSTDSRDVKPGDLFIALKGDRFDGHDFVEAALRQGAVGTLVESGYGLAASVQRGSQDRAGRGSRHTSGFILSVADPLFAYQQLASHHRKRFDIPVVAVTGSNGKTTTKEMVGCVLAERWSILKTEGNLNNRIGVPQTLLRLTSRHQAAVIEMGVDNKGQTTRLAEIVRPTIGLITNIGPDHLEFFGTLEASAQAKGELLDLLGPDEAATLNADDPFFDYLAARARCRVLAFGCSPKAQVRATEVRADQRGTTVHLSVPDRRKPLPVRLGVFGLHNVSNALAAAAVGSLCNLSGEDIAQGLARFRPATMRSQVETLNEITVINDCYNANPASTKAAVTMLVELGAGARTIAVLGDMLELGPESTALHRDVGAHVAAQGVSYLIACGSLGAELAEGARAAGLSGGSIRVATDAGEAAKLVPSIVRHRDVVLVKASRGMRMEQVVEALRHRSSGSHSGHRKPTGSVKGRKR
jgi:UDP-N-acetylmuramoyl-tripeptide--D-alanyl-D-alanine ligase